METSLFKYLLFYLIGTIAERTRARGTNHEEVESEIPFDSLQFNQNAMDPELKEKEELIFKIVFE